MDEKLQKAIKMATVVLTTVVTLSLIVWAWSKIDQQMNTYPVRSASFTGRAKVTVKPDTASISVAVITQAKNAQDAQTENDKKIVGIRDFLKQGGIVDADIKTTSYNLFPQYDNSYCSKSVIDSSMPVEPCVPRIVGYEMNQTLEFKTKDFEKLGSILAQITERGANQIYGVNFTVEDPESVKATAVSEAVAKANEKAKNYANVTGFKLGRLMNVSESGGDYYYGMDGKGGFGGGAYAEKAVAIEPGTQDITIDVTLTYEMK